MFLFVICTCSQYRIEKVPLDRVECLFRPRISLFYFIFSIGKITPFSKEVWDVVRDIFIELEDSLHVRVDPVHEVACLGVDSRVAGLGASVSPADDTILNSCISFLAHKWSSRVALAGVFAAICDSVQVHIWNACAEFIVFNLLWTVGRCDTLFAGENVYSNIFQLKDRS